MRSALFVLFGFCVDRAIKYTVVQSPDFSSGVFGIGGHVIGFTRHINPYFAFSINMPNHVVAGLTAIAVGCILYFFVYRKTKIPTPAGIWWILAGAASNLFDRIVYGGVVDYLVVPWGGIINIADGMVLLGVVLLLLDAEDRSGGRALRTYTCSQK